MFNLLRKRKVNTEIGEDNVIEGFSEDPQSLCAIATPGLQLVDSRGRDQTSLRRSNASLTSCWSFGLNNDLT